MNLELAVKILIIAAISAYALSFATAFIKKKPALALFLLGWLINLSVFIMNWIAGGEPPFGNMYHVMIAISLGFLPAYIFLERFNKLGWLMPYFSIAPVIPLTGTFFMGHEINWNRIPALQSPWFVPHVASYVLSYSLNTVGVILFAVLLFRRFFLKKEDWDKYAGAIYRVLLLAFPFMTFGMLSGALWAEEAWGGYWSWDVKETWSLITWTLYLIYFHCVRTPSLRKTAPWIQFAAFLALLTTFLAVNYNLIPKIQSLLHSY